MSYYLHVYRYSEKYAVNYAPPPNTKKCVQAITFSRCFKGTINIYGKSEDSYCIFSYTVYEWNHMSQTVSIHVLYSNFIF